MGREWREQNLKLREDLVPKNIPTNLMDKELNLPVFLDWKISKKIFEFPLQFMFF